MTFPYEQAVIDFDLDFFQPTSNRTLSPDKSPPDKFKEKNDKVRAAVGLAKQKITAIDSMLRKYYENKKQLSQVEKALYASKEECKQACIDTRNISEKCTQLEQEVQRLHIYNKELQEKLVNSQNLVSAVQSHANQLEILVTEKETIIESFNNENRLEKNSLAKDEKKLVSCQKENAILMRHIYVMKDIVFGKRKLSKKFKAILEKYDNDSDDSNPLLGEIISDEETDIDCNLFSPPMSPAYKKRKISDAQKSTIRTTDESHITKDDDSDLIEVTSLDTGCGSSLAFYDNDKCFNSPDYLMQDSPINTDTADLIKVNTVEAATSPIPILKRVHVATSPLRALDIVHTPIPMPVHEMCTTPEPIFEISSPSSTVDSTISNHETVKISSSQFVPKTLVAIPAQVEVCKTPETNLLHDKSESVNTTVSNKTIIPNIIEEELHCEKRNVHKEAINEKECLELNSSDNFDKKYTRDCEVEMILTKMRFDHALITPLPSTPPKSQNAAYGGGASIISCGSLQDREFVCKDAIKVREENKILTSRVMNMEVELKALKNLLINKNVIDQQNTEPSEINTNSIHISSLSDDDNDDMTSDPISILAVTTEQTNIVTNDKHPSRVIKRLQFEEPLWPMANPISVFIENELREDSVKEVEDLDKTPQKQTISKTVKQRKLTKLDRFRKKLLPKSKIKTVLTSPIKKSYVKSKQLTVPVKSFATTKLINNKSAYEKALKVMLEMKSQQKVKKAKQTSISKAPKKRKLRQKLNSGQEIITDVQPGHESCKTELPHVNEELIKLQIDNKEEKSETTQIDMKKNNLINEQCVLSKKTGRKKSGEYKASLCNKITVDFEIRKSSEKDASHSNGNVLPKTLTACKSNKTKDLDATRTTESDTGTNIIKETNKSIRLDTSEATPMKTLYTGTNVTNQTNESVQLDSSEIPLVKESHNTSSNILEEANKSMRLDSCDITSMKGSLNTRNNTVKELMTSVAKCDITINVNKPPLTSPRMSTRKRKCVLDKTNSPNQKQDLLNDKPECDVQKPNEPDVIRQCDNNIIQERSRKRIFTEKPEIECKRTLRSSTRRQSIIAKDNSKNDITDGDSSMHCNLESKQKASHVSDKIHSCLKENIVTYGDLDLFNEAIEDIKTVTQQPTEDKTYNFHLKDSIFCKMIDKYGKATFNCTKKISDNIVISISETIVSEIDNIRQLHSNDMKRGINNFVEIVMKWKYKHFISGLMHYLKDSQRKVELFNKMNCPPAMNMTKSEQILMDVLAQLRHSWLNFNVIETVLQNIEYVLFKLNRTPDFDTIESMGHFYAVVCRHFNMKSQLRTFMLNAMYCIQYKAVPLIQQCLEVWMHVLPLVHKARSPLVLCIVYLLHFYKCDDKFRRVQGLRNLLRRKYFYVITEWNEEQLILMFQKAIRNVRGKSLEDKLLRMALILLAKRQGPQWTENVLLKNVILPMKDDNQVPEKVKTFCISILGSLIKPFPMEMKINCEIHHNMLTDMLKQKPSPPLEEAIFTSLIYTSRQNYARVIKLLVTWQPRQISPSMENLLRQFVREKPLKMWEKTLSRIQII